MRSFRIGEEKPLKIVINNKFYPISKTGASRSPILLQALTEGHNEIQISPQTHIRDDSVQDFINILEGGSANLSAKNILDIFELALQLKIGQGQFSQSTILEELKTHAIEMLDPSTKSNPASVAELEGYNDVIQTIRRHEDSINDLKASYSLIKGQQGESISTYFSKRITIDCEDVDLGNVISENIRPFSELTIYLEKDVTWDIDVIIPAHSTVNIISKAHHHKNIQEKSGDREKGVQEDSQRCPRVISMSKIRYIQVQGVQYTFHWRAKLREYSSMTIQGVTIRESINEEGTHYEPGLFMLSSPFCNLSLRDSRIEMTHFACVTGHSASISYVLLGHVRFVKDSKCLVNSEKRYPVYASRGHSWTGQLVEASLYDVILEDNFELFKNEKITYLQVQSISILQETQFLFEKYSLRCES